MKDPTRTELLVLRAHIDAILQSADPAPWAEVSALRVIAHEITRCDYFKRYWDLLESRPDPRQSENPELRSLIAAVDRWNNKSEWKHRAANDLAREEHDKLVASMQAEPREELSTLPVARASSVQQATAEVQSRSKGDE